MAIPQEDYLGITDYKVVGTRPVRHDGADKVTGRAIYGTDLNLPDMLHARVLRSPHAHARIKSIDTSKAEALEGVRAVVTGQDLVLNAEEQLADLGEEVVRVKDMCAAVLAREKVLYQGYPVAAVAATNIHIAEEALDLIEVEYEVLPHVLDVREAMKDDAPLVHEDQRTNSMGERSENFSNVASHFRTELGDIEQGFAEADVVVEREFLTDMVHQGYIEPQNATVLWNADGVVTIWCSNQGAFGVRDQTARILGIPVSQIKVVPLEIGGGFGGKIKAYLEPIAALLSRKTGHPVKMIMSRTEVLQATGPTSGSWIRVKMGATNDGKLVAAESELVYEAGAFSGSPVGAGARNMLAPYVIPHVLVDGYDVVNNKPSSSAYRAPGTTNAAFAVETVVDELAEKLGVDPLEFRLDNSAKEGTRRADGPVNKRIGHEECVRAAVSSDHYQTALNGKYRGRGVASGFWGNGGGVSSAAASVNDDGTINLVEGSTDIGGTRTSVAMQMAEVLGISEQEIRPQVGDTDSIGYTGVTGGSRTTFATGWAAYKCAQDIKEQMMARAAILWEISEDDIEFDQGVFQSKSDPSKSITFKDLAAKLDSTGGPVMGRATAKPTGVGGCLCGGDCGCGGRSRYGQGRYFACVDFPGCGESDLSALCGGADAGRRGAGDWLGAQRRVCVR